MEGKRIDSKLVLFTLVLVLITLLLLNHFLKSNSINDIWDYKNITTAGNIIYIGEKVEDRNTYYTLENIINTFINSYLSKDMNYKDYYEVLREDYKDFLGKKKYYKAAEDFLKKFYINIGSDYQSMDTKELIKEIYLFNNNVYLCRLESSYSNQEAYIAVMLNESNNLFNIVYIE